MKFYTASLWAESVLKTYATGGESQRLFGLLVDSLGELQRRPAAESERVSVHFVWRFLEYSGLQPDLEHSAVSGEFLAENAPIYYSSREQGFCAADEAGEQMPRWQPGAAAYLRYAGTRGAGRGASGHSARRRDRADQARALRILEEHVESPLNALRSGSGIL